MASKAYPDTPEVNTPEVQLPGGSSIHSACNEGPGLTAFLKLGEIDFVNTM